MIFVALYSGHLAGRLCEPQGYRSQRDLDQRVDQQRRVHELAGDQEKPQGVPFVEDLSKT